MKQINRRSSLTPEEFVNELKQVISEPARQYENAVIRLAIIRQDGELKVSFGRVDFLPKDDTRANELTYDYNNFVLTQSTKKASEIPDFLNNLIQGNPVGINSLQNVKCEFEQQIRWDNEEIPSNTEWGYIKSEFPTLYYSSRLANQNIDSRLILAGKNLRPYPNASYAITDFMNLHMREDWGKYLNENKLMVIAPDFRIRIKKMTIMKNKVNIELDSKNLNNDEIFSQFYLDGEAKSDVQIVDNKAEAESLKEPNEILAVILDRKSGEILDYKKYELRWGDYDSSIQKEDPEDVIKEWINRGENEFVEFKEGLKHADDVMKTIVAFANTNGGVIIFGVKDDGSIVGYNEPAQNTRNRLERMISSKCDPPVDFSVKRIEFDNTGITYIKIPKGKSRLYAVTNGPIYVRRGASDIFIKPSEIIEIFSTKSSNTSGSFGY